MHLSTTKIKTKNSKTELEFEKNKTGCITFLLTHDHYYYVQSLLSLHLTFCFHLSSCYTVPICIFAYIYT